jgi:4-amino-4-deoxy-L-arabinose transferase-like glycosyltransferase
MQTPQPDPGRIRLKPPAAILGLLAILLGWVFFLRWPTFSAPLWNVDEAIHAAVARTLLDGGVLYRDAVDQRTPLTYYAVALLFRLFGENNLWALRAAVAVILAGTALGLFLLGRHAKSTAMGAWAALIFCALTTNLLFPHDGNALHTEWFVIQFTTWGTWWFWRTQARTDAWPAAVTGVLFGLAFLSKQPALLDFAAPLLTVCYAAATGQRRFADAARSLGGMLAGFLAVNAAVLLYFAARGALADLFFYTWTYNLRYYGPEVTLAERLLTAFKPFGMLLKEYPLVLFGLLVATILHLVRLTQLRPTAEERAGQPFSFYLLMWCVTSLAAAASGGRGFDHYYIQCIPAFALSAGWFLTSVGSYARRHLRLPVVWSRPTCAGIAAALLVGVTALSAVVCPIASRGKVGYPGDPARHASAFIKSLTAPDERIFVWGYNPDIYLYTDRRPASRFVYSSFQTGLIPWTNIAPDKDTTYAIVPGSMKALLADLETRRPTFIVDCGVGPHRSFSKYPLARFAPLQDFVSRNYVETESGQFLPEGFKLHLIKDAARRAPVPLAGGPPSRLAAPEVIGPRIVAPVPTGFLVVGHDPDRRLQRLALIADGKEIDSVSFASTGSMTVRFEVPFDTLGPGRHHLLARATDASGATSESAVSEAACDASSVPPEQLPSFALACVTSTVTPLSVRTPFAPTANWEGEHHVFFAHAFSVLSYPLIDGVARVRGGFSIRPGAYAPDNPAPTDGAEFRVEWVMPNEERRILFRRLLQPRNHPDDRPLQFFTADLPPHAQGGRLEFVITPGPADNAACDWTYWADLQIETSH